MNALAYDVVVYQHMPKCGGRSFIDASQDRFHRVHDTPPSYSTKADRIEFAKTKKDFSTFEAPTLLHGHLVHDLIRPAERYPEELKSDRVAVVTVVRDPLERAISAYFHRRKRGRETGATLEEWLAGRKNHVCAGLGITFRGGKPVNDLFLLIGLTERLQDSVRAFSGLLGFPETTLEHLNKSPRDQYELSPALLRAFQKANAMDYELVAYANQRLDAILDAIAKGNVEPLHAEYRARKRVILKA